MKTKTQIVREGGLDKFYTIPEISEKCLKIIGTLYDWSVWGLVIEPSAGNGSFLIRIPTDKKLVLIFHQNIKILLNRIF